MNTNNSSFTSLRRFWSLCIYIYVTTRRYISILWIKINRYIDQPDRLFVPGRLNLGNAKHNSITPSPYHKVVIIGDGLAFGLGDTGVVVGSTAGVGPHISRSVKNDPRIRRPWKILNRGDANTTSTAWLPETAKGDNKSTTAGKHYNAVFCQANGIGQDADIVILMTGISDVIFASEMGLQTSNIMPEAADKRHPLRDLPYPQEEISRIVQNIAAIAKSLRDDGKRVCVVDIPTTIPGIPNIGRGILRRLNQQMRQVVNQLNEDLDSTLHTEIRRNKEQNPQQQTKQQQEGTRFKIQYISLGNNHTLQRQEYRSFDSIYFNRSGYKKLALDLYDEALRTMMISVEWDVWKGAFSQKKNNHCTFQENTVKMD
mmetsp:Transcript_23086/g.33991  ORF Transcript_23086/g.33991 Transcript_23086/m.33991 type:complete len:371 (-) Transcript_23086:392-1504(-)